MIHLKDQRGVAMILELVLVVAVLAVTEAGGLSYDTACATGGPQDQQFGQASSTESMHDVEEENLHGGPVRRRKNQPGSPFRG